MSLGDAMFVSVIVITMIASNYFEWLLLPLGIMALVAIVHWGGDIE